MAGEKLCFKQYINCIDNNKQSKTRKKTNKKSHKGRYYGGGTSDGNAGDGGMGESVTTQNRSLLSEFTGTVFPKAFSATQLAAVPRISGEEEQEKKIPKYKLAVNIVQSMYNENRSRDDIIQFLIDQLNVTESTAITYYERILRDSGLKKSPNEEEPEDDAPDDEVDASGDLGDDEGQMDLEDTQDESSDPDRMGVIRTVPNAHLVYKRQNEEGTYDELWVYNIDRDMKNELETRHSILAGTDIPPKKVQSEDGSQRYTLTTLGNAQLLHITGLPQ